MAVHHIAVLILQGSVAFKEQLTGFVFRVGLAGPGHWNVRTLRALGLPMPDTERTLPPALADRIEAVIRLVREELSSGGDSITLADYERLIDLREALGVLIADVYAGAIYKAD